MRRFSVLLPILLCTLVLLGCQIVPKDMAEPVTAPTAPFAAIPVTQPPETAIPVQTEAIVHSPLFLPELSAEDVICYFEEVCLSAEYVNSGNPSLVQKWAEPLVYQIHGTPTPEDLATLEHFAAGLNEIPGFPGIWEAQNPEEATINIHFCCREDFLALMGNNFLGSDGGVTFWYKENQIYQAVVGICTDLDQSLRNAVILEELYNGLGPVQDTNLRSDSIIWSGFSAPQELTDIDWLVLKLLYCQEMQCGWDAAACEALIRELYY